MASAFAMLFFMLFSDAGPVNALAVSMGWIEEPVRFLTQKTTVRTLVAVMNLLMWYGNTTLLLMSGILGIDNSIFEAARIDGANPFTIFVKVTLPSLMPNPKAGTVTMDVTKAINDIKAGKIEYRLDKTNIIHVPIGKASFTEEQLSDNFQTLIEAIVKARPSTLKGQYMKSIVLTPTMGPGVKVNPAKFA